MFWVGGALVEVIATPPGQLFSEINDDSEAILTYGTAHVLLAGDAEAKEEEYSETTHNPSQGYMPR